MIINAAQMISRRSCLTGVLISLSGCYSNPSNTVRIGEIEVINKKEKDVDFSLIVDDGESEVHNSDYSLNSQEKNRIDNIIINGSWLDTENDLNIKMETNNSESINTSTNEVGKYTESDCVNLLFKIEDENIELQYGTSGCES